MDTVSNIATIVGLVRDILLLLLLAVALVTLLLLAAMIRKLFATVGDTAEAFQEAVKKISENVMNPQTHLSLIHI